MALLYALWDIVCVTKEWFVGNSVQVGLDGYILVIAPPWSASLNQQDFVRFRQLQLYQFLEKK